MVKSAETVDPREGRKNIPALPSRSHPSLSQVAPHTLAPSNLQTQDDTEVFECWITAWETPALLH